MGTSSTVCGCRPASSPGLAEFEAELSPTRLFSCTDAERTHVAGVLGRPISAAQARAAVGGAMTKARRDASTVVRALRTHPRSSRTTRIFRSVFNVPPTFVPDWRPANASWRDLGELVAIRVENAARIVVGGHMRVFCWGSVANCPECTSPPTDYVACSSYRGRYHICLGRQWWLWHGAGKLGFTGSTFLHEALHIYFRLEHHRATVGRPSVNNVYCYETLIALLVGREPKPGHRDRCARGRVP